MTEKPLLFTPLSIRGVQLKNRIAVSPMAQYSANNGYPVSHHLLHYGKFAQGKAGLIFVEATAVTREGRITNGCLGLWEDSQINAFKPITGSIKENGSVPAIQIGHGGRKSSMQRPWHGNGPPADTDKARGDEIWQPIGASAEPLSEGWLTPREMTEDDCEQVADDFADAAQRAIKAGFEIIEIHMAHGYLLHSFLSPLSNFRTDRFGGSLEARMALPTLVAHKVRQALPDSTPLFARLSCVDGVDDGWSIDDSVALAKQLKATGVDVIDCSSGGNSPRGATNANLKRGPGYQAPYAQQIRDEAEIMTQAVGLIRTGTLAEALLQQQKADIIAVGRDFLYNPNWALHAAEELGLTGDFEEWPYQYAWWLEKWQKGLKGSGNW
jgi:2,4-dienoyl-CoA reductase-like NADH-dependent reductase (Old Yellow Enzyme family)